MEATINELHKPARRNYPRRKYDIRDLNETFQMDIVDMQKYSKENKNYRYILTVIDIFSKFSFAIPLKSKSAGDVTDAMVSVLKLRKPKKIHVDKGTEFWNSKFKSLMKKHNIHMYSTFSNLKASIVERFNRTLKEKMFKHFSLIGKYKYYDVLPQLVLDYNQTVHSKIKMRPIDVTKENSRQLYQRIYLKDKLKVNDRKNKFNVGDVVRISKFKHIFEKGYTPNWTTENFTVKKINNTIPHTYILKDHKGNPIQGCFYEHEMLKTKHPDVYLVEKIIKKRGNRCYVKWLGFDSSENSWVNKEDILN